MHWDLSDSLYQMYEPRQAYLSFYLVFDMKFIYFQFKENARAIYNKLSECKAIVFLIFERSEQTIALYIQFANFMYHNYMVWIYREFSFMVLILLAIYKIWIESNLNDNTYCIEMKFILLAPNVSCSIHWFHFFQSVSKTWLY